jgi:hypothetical protein
MMCNFCFSGFFLVFVFQLDSKQAKKGKNQREGKRKEAFFSARVCVSHTRADQMLTKMMCFSRTPKRVILSKFHRRAPLAAATTDNAFYSTSK